MDPFFLNEGKLTRALYQNVSNAGELRKLILTAQLPLCLLKPKFIVDDFQLSVAITKALYNQKDNMMTTKTFPSELIYCLSPLRNINQSLKIFGSEENDTDVIIVGDEGFFQTIKDSIKGDEIELSEISKFTDFQSVIDLYEITHEELTKSSLLDSVVTRMATK